MRPTKVAPNPFAIWASILNTTEGRFFTVEFVKKNGTLRRLNGRIFEYIDPNSGATHLIVKDVQRKGFRKIDPRTVRAFKCGNFKVGRFSDE